MRGHVAAAAAAAAAEAAVDIAGLFGGTEVMEISTVYRPGWQTYDAEVVLVHIALVGPLALVVLDSGIPGDSGRVADVGYGVGSQRVTCSIRAAFYSTAWRQNRGTTHIEWRA